MPHGWLVNIGPGNGLVPWGNKPLPDLFRHMASLGNELPYHDGVIQWKHFPRYWPFVRGNPRLSVNSPHRGQWRGSLMDVFFDLHLNEQLSKQSWGWWFKMPWRPMLSHNVSWFIYVFEASALIGLDMVFGKRLVQTRAMTFTVIEYSAGLRNAVFCKWRESFDQVHLTVTCPHTHHLFFFYYFSGLSTCLREIVHNQHDMDFEMG